MIVKMRSISFYALFEKKNPEIVLVVLFVDVSFEVLKHDFGVE